MLRRVARILTALAMLCVIARMQPSRADAADAEVDERAPDVAAPPIVPTAEPTAAPEALAPADATGPMRVAIGLYATAIPEIDIKAGTFTVDMYLWMVHRGDESIETFEITNGEVISKDLLERTTRDGITYVCWRVKAQMRTPMSLEDYPFDRQQLSMHVEHTQFEIDKLVYEPDLASYQRSGVARERWGLREGLSVPEYEVTGTTWSTAESIYRTDFGSPFNAKVRTVFSRAVYTIDVARSFLPYCYKILVPLAVIIAIAYLVFFLPPDEIQSASGLAMTSLLTCVAMNLTVSSNLPEVGYLVASDKFFICTYALIFVTLCETVWTYALAKSDQFERAERIERYFRWGFPVGFALSFAYLAVQAVT